MTLLFSILYMYALWPLLKCNSNAITLWSCPLSSFFVFTKRRFICSLDSHWMVRLERLDQDTVTLKAHDVSMGQIEE